MRAARWCSVAAVVTAAVVVSALVVRGRVRRLRREALSERLVAGRVGRDNVVLRADVERFRRRLAVEVAAGDAVDGALARPAPARPGSGFGVGPVDGGSS